ncbi:MAG: N-acetylneuraminate synthase [Lentisphaeraceae bacterium]|nr:N-acetylneuraminate synthase [Lentisphaeraceae bacterium]
MPCLIIAEIGVNHNGDIELAKKMIDSAIESGADVVKFQTYIADEVMTDKTPLADYMGDDAENFLELARRLELSLDETIELKRYTENAGAEFMSSPFDVPSTYSLHKIGLKRLKIPSGETVNPFVLKAAAETKLPLIISTGMCDLEEVREALDFLKKNQSGPVTVLHCTTQYPAEVKNVNLKAMKTLSDEFGLPVGYSDHTAGIEVSLAAVAHGAEVIEKHFTIDRSLPGPDQEASMLPEELRALVDGIRKIELCLGHGEKVPYPVELEVAKVARKSLVLNQDLTKGSKISMENLTAKRPGTGIRAFDFEKVIGKELTRDLPKNHILTEEDFS